MSRLRDKVVTTMTETAKRYVITNPSFDFGLLPTDQVSVLPPQLKKKYESVQLQNINHYFISTQKTNLLCHRHADIACVAFQFYYFHQGRRFHICFQKALKVNQIWKALLKMLYIDRCMFYYLLKDSRVGLVSVKQKFDCTEGKQGRVSDLTYNYRFLFLSIGIRDLLRFDK